MQDYPVEQGGIGSKLLSPVVLSLIIVTLIGIFCFHIYTLGQGNHIYSAVPGDTMTVRSEGDAHNDQQTVSYPVHYPDSRMSPGHPSHPPY